MSILIAETRRAASGIWLLLPGVTPNTDKDSQWRRQAGWAYTPGGVPVEEQGGAFWPFEERRQKAFQRLNDQIRRRRDEARALRAQIEALYEPARPPEPVRAKPAPEAARRKYEIQLRDNTEAKRLASTLQSIEAEIEVLATKLLEIRQDEDEEDAIALLML